MHMIHMIHMMHMMTGAHTYIHMMKSANESEYYPDGPEDAKGVPRPLWRVKFSKDINDADLDANELAEVCWYGVGVYVGVGVGVGGSGSVGVGVARRWRTNCLEGDQP